MDEQDTIMISAINRYLYCPRRCALAHIEQEWNKTVHTTRGDHVHEAVHDDSSQEMGGVRIERALPVWSVRLKIYGIADLVEFRDNVPYPVEYKVSRRKNYENDIIQLCAQAICLEEMLGVPVLKGAIFWYGSRKRQEIEFTTEMRKRVETVVAEIYSLLDSRIVPSPVNDKRCIDCSLKEACMPEVIAEEAHSRRAVKELFEVR